MSSFRFKGGATDRQARRQSLVLAHKFLFSNQPDQDTAVTVENLTQELKAILLHSEAKLRTLVRMNIILRTVYLHWYRYSIKFCNDVYS